MRSQLQAPRIKSCSRADCPPQDVSHRRNHQARAGSIRPLVTDAMMRVSAAAAVANDYIAANPGSSREDANSVVPASDSIRRTFHLSLLMRSLCRASHRSTRRGDVVLGRAISQCNAGPGGRDPEGAGLGGETGARALGEVIAERDGGNEGIAFGDFRRADRVAATTATACDRNSGRARRWRCARMVTCSEALPERRRGTLATFPPSRAARAWLGSHVQRVRASEDGGQQWPFPPTADSGKITLQINCVGRCAVLLVEARRCGAGRSGATPLRRENTVHAPSRSSWEGSQPFAGHTPPEIGAASAPCPYASTDHFPQHRLSDRAVPCHSGATARRQRRHETAQCKNATERHDGPTTRIDDATTRPIGMRVALETMRGEACARPTTAAVWRAVIRLVARANVGLGSLAAREERAAITELANVPLEPLRAVAWLQRYERYAAAREEGASGISPLPRCSDLLPISGKAIRRECRRRRDASLPPARGTSNEAKSPRAALSSAESISRSNATLSLLWGCVRRVDGRQKPPAELAGVLPQNCECVVSFAVARFAYGASSAARALGAAANRTQIEFQSAARKIPAKTQSRAARIAVAPAQPPGSAPECPQPYPARAAIRGLSARAAHQPRTRSIRSEFPETPCANSPQGSIATVQRIPATSANRSPSNRAADG